MKANIIPCLVFHDWRETALKGHPGTYLPSVTSLPGGLTVVLAINDRTDRSVLRSVPKIRNAVAACFSIAMRNQSLVEWQVGFVGRSDSGNIYFEGREKEFSIAKVCSKITYGDQGGNCAEVSVSVSNDSLEVEGIEVITGRVELHNPHVRYYGCDYNVVLDPDS
ncbi:hypothetical protein [Rhodoplanes sp. SY1]|uniref:hypothetical protein n=1 Tax=Rhodoplanes sp. SY1 TaxID=3166646 RepID=UPI0038B52972